MSRNKQDSVFRSVTASGLTKRELFAAMALQGYCANAGIWSSPPEEDKKVAKAAVLAADALIEELNRMEE